MKIHCISRKGERRLQLIHLLQRGITIEGHEDIREKKCWFSAKKSVAAAASRPAEKDQRRRKEGIRVEIHCTSRKGDRHLQPVHLLWAA